MEEAIKLTSEQLRSFYVAMLRIREAEERISDLVAAKEVKCPCHLYSGEEAIAVGICFALGSDDLVFGNHRSHGHFLAKGGSLEAMFAEIYGKESGCSRGRGGSMHLIDPAIGMLGSAPIVAGTISLAMGAALAISIRGADRVAVSFFGDGATGEGVLYECLNFAALKKLPLVFVCENNLYATHMPILECRADKSIYQVGIPFCVESSQVDGNDVLAVYETARKAVDRCRQGEGPVLIECLTYRFRGHVGPNDNIQGTHTEIRPREEVESWRQKDPILRFERYLLDHHFIDHEGIKSIRQDVASAINGAQDYAIKSQNPQRGELLKYVLA